MVAGSDPYVLHSMSKLRLRLSVWQTAMFPPGTPIPFIKGMIQARLLILRDTELSFMLLGPWHPPGKPGLSVRILAPNESSPDYLLFLTLSHPTLYVSFWHSFKNHQNKVNTILYKAYDDFNPV